MLATQGAYRLRMEQHTLQRPIRAHGTGLHSGERVGVTLFPAPVDHGVVFLRTDLPGSPAIRLGMATASETTLCTGLAENGHSVRTVEHLLAALVGLGVDNVRVEIDAPELPIFDGSAATWVHLIHEAGLFAQGVGKLGWRLKAPVSIAHGQSTAELTPAGSFTADVTIHFDHPAIETQSAHAAWDGSTQQFEATIARARTFGFMDQVERMAENHLGLGGSLDNAVVYGQHNIANRDGLRLPDEAAQHKLLDAMGDLFALGRLPLAHLTSVRPGHTINQALVVAARESGHLEPVRWHEGQWMDQLQADRALGEQLGWARSHALWAQSADEPKWRRWLHRH